MASRISQMRNAMQQPRLSQQQLNKSIEQVRGMMYQIKNAQDPQLLLTQFLQNNSNTGLIANMLQNGNGLESIAKSMAQANDIDINQLINQLEGGL